MAITDKYFKNEPIKAVFNFSSPFEVETNPNENNEFIRSLDFHFINNNTSVNPVGIVQSSTVNLEVYVPSDKLNPTNVNSEYYEELTNGLKVDLFIKRGEAWEPYGVWFVSSWNGGYSEGINNINSISLEDCLNSEFSVEMPKIEARGNAKVGDLIEEVFNKIGLSDEDYIIDEDLDTSLTYAIGSGGKVRDFLNSACALLLAKVRVDLSGIIHIEKALNFNEFNNEITLSSDDIVSLSSTNTENINYNKIIISYLSSSDFTRAVILDEVVDSLTVGENQLSFNSNNIIISIEQIRLEVLNHNCLISDLISSAYQKEINLNIVVEGEASTYARIYVEGILASSKNSEVTAEISTGSKRGGIPYTLELNQVLSKSEAEEILEKLTEYVKIMSKRVNLSGTYLTTEIQPSDKIVIEGAGSYDGVYKVLSTNISYNSSYTHDLELVRIGEV